MEKQLEASLVGGLHLFKNELDQGEPRFMLGSSKEEVFCNGDECIPFGINEETYRIFLESMGGLSYYYTQYGEEIPLEDHYYHQKMGTRILCDTYFKTRDQAIETAQALIQVFDQKGSEGLTKYADQVVSELWKSFEETGVNMKEEITSDFHIWTAGAYKEEIWHWFDRSHSQGLAIGLMRF